MTQNWNVFIWITNVLHFLRLFFARCCSAPFFKRFVPEIVPFFRKTHQICHCEEGAFFAPDAAILNETICHPVTKYGRAKRNRTLEGRERTRNDAAIPTFFVTGIPFCLVLPCFATGCHTFGLKIATAAPRPRNDTKLRRFSVFFAQKAPKMCEQAPRKLFVCAALVVENSHLLVTRS